MAISNRALGSRGPAPALRPHAVPVPHMLTSTRAAQHVAARQGTANHPSVVHLNPLRAPTKAHIGE